MSFLRHLRRSISPWKRQLLHGARKPQVENYDPSRTIILASAGRSGSTWVAGTLNWGDDLRYIFEPFHPRWVPEFGEACRYEFVDPQAPGKWAEPINNVVHGRLENAWSDQYNRLAHVDRRLIKAVRANLMLPHIALAHPEVCQVLVVRHPLSQALSAITGGWQLGAEMFLQQPALLRNYPALGSLLERDLDPFLAAVQSWAVIHWLPLQAMSPDQLHVVFYESFVESPEQQFEALFEFLGQPYDRRALANVRVASRTARTSANIDSDRISKWKSNVPLPKIESALRILARFGLDEIYGDDVRPRVNALQCFELARGAVSGAQP